MISGTACKLGDFVNTDLLFTNKYDDRGQSLDEIAARALQNVPGLGDGAILVGGTNFGAVSSRELAIKVMRKIGVVAVVAVSFSRLFYRNAINNGLYAFVCDTAAIHDGDLVEIDPSKGSVTVPKRDVVLQTAPLPPFLSQLVEAGGLLPYVRLHPNWL